MLALTMFSIFRVSKFLVLKTHQMKIVYKNETKQPEKQQKIK